MYEPLRFMEQIESMITIPNARYMEDMLNRRSIQWFGDIIKKDRAGFLAECATMWTCHINNEKNDEILEELGISRDSVEQLYEDRKKEFERGLGLLSPNAEDFYHHALMNIIHYDWTRNKRVYKIDPAVAEDFMNMNVPKEVKTDVFSKLPSKCFYIDFGASMHFCEGACGTFVLYDIVGKTAIFSVTTIVPKGRLLPVTTVFRVGIDDEKDISTELSMFRESYSVSLEDGTTVTFYEREFVKYFFNFCLYLKAANNDVEYTERTKSIYKPARKGFKPTNRIREVEEFGVGFRYSTSIPNRKSATGKEQANEESAEPREKRGYTSCYRSAHWQTYWVNDEENPGKKKAVLRWIKEVYVHGSKQPTKAVVHMVTK